MDLLIANHHEVQQFLPMSECIDVVEAALKMLNQGNALNPLRSGMWLPDKSGLLGVMSGYLGDPEIMGLKTVSVFLGNDKTEYHSHQGSVMIFETKNGRPLAIMDAAEITAIRTGAASGVATRLLANPNADDLAILGSGVQARMNLGAMITVRPIKKVRVWSKTQSNAQQLADSESKKHGIPIEVMQSAQSAVEGASIICTTTAAREPILMGDWLAEGTHINAVGSSIKFTRELDTAAVVKSRLFVDRKESTINEAGDYLFPKEEGAIDESHIQGEIGDILLNKVRGRRSETDITLFKSLGLAIEDLAAAYHVYEKMEATGQGTRVELGSTKHF